MLLQPETESIEETMKERNVKIKKIKDKMNRVEDDVFVHFCNELGVENIRLENGVV